MGISAIDALTKELKKTQIQEAACIDQEYGIVLYPYKYNQLVKFGRELKDSIEFLKTLYNREGRQA